MIQQLPDIVTLVVRHCVRTVQLELYATIVVLVVYVFMPMVTGWFAGWLQDDDEGAAS
ncbi:hypothetical protein [Pseudomonas karstica]|uniref:hypothetical protein n=1 Tax=Pseudomonas karstica TaxID=1055468 RepID=UPI0015B3ABF5|nr:hypothetical protein [Pseudomonas karstica]